MGQRQSEIIKNHMEVYWHDYASASKGVPITEAGLVEKASVIGRTADAAGMRHRRMACPKLHEHPFAGAGSHNNSGYRPVVH